MRAFTLGMAAATLLESAAALTPAPVGAQEALMMPAPIVDANGPIRQGNMCKQRIQPGQADGIAWFAPCTDKKAASRQQRRRARRG